MARFLAIGAHPDDVEIGMGGTIIALKAKGHDVFILDLTNGEPTPFGSVEVRAKESAEAARILGVNQRITLNLPNRYLMDSLEARKEVAEVIRELRPDILFAHYWVDAHPDHKASSQITEAARFYAKLTKTEMKGTPFFPKKIYYFFCTHFRLFVKPAFIYDVSSFIDKKIQAVQTYKSQFREERGNLGIFDNLKEVARWWGSLIRVPFGEPFVCREQIGLHDFEAIL